MRYQGLEDQKSIVLHMWKYAYWGSGGRTSWTEFCLLKMYILISDCKKKAKKRKTSSELHLKKLSLIEKWMICKLAASPATVDSETLAQPCDGRKFTDRKSKVMYRKWQWGA